MKISGEKKKILALAGTFLTMFALAVLIIVSVGYGLNPAYGWFAINKRVNAVDMSVKNSEMPYELAVSGAQATPYLNNSAIVNYLRTNEEYEKISITDGSHTKILCDFINDSPHDPDVLDISPGSYGRISFDIVKKWDEDMEFVISFDYLPIGGTEDTPAAVPAANIDEVKSLLSGHILLFETRSALINGGYYYSDHIDNGYITFSTEGKTPDSTGADGDHYTIEFYWIWPSTFGQLTLPLTDGRLHSHGVFNVETERGDMLEFVKDNPEKFFKDTFVSSLGTDIDLDNPPAGRNYEDYYFVELSEAYNDGDQFIGDNVKYLILTAQVERTIN